MSSHVSQVCPHFCRSLKYLSYRKKSVIDIMLQMRNFHLNINWQSLLLHQKNYFHLKLLTLLIKQKILYNYLIPGCCSCSGLPTLSTSSPRCSRFLCRPSRPPSSPPPRISTRCPTLCPWLRWPQDDQSKCQCFLFICPRNRRVCVLWSVFSVERNRYRI